MLNRSVRVEIVMTEPPSDDREALREFVERWRRAGDEVARVEAEELRTIDQAAATRIAAAGAVALLRIDPPGPSSGLVELQRWFALARRRLASVDPSSRRSGEGADSDGRERTAE